MKRISLALCIAALASAPAAAQFMRDTTNRPAYEPGADVRNGYTAEDLRDAELRGPNGGSIGDIEDMVIGPDGQLRRLLVDVNEGLFGIGGERLAIDWSDVRPGPRQDGRVEYFTAPVTKDNVKSYGIFTGRTAAVEGKGREWRAGELLGDYVNLEDAEDFGSVIDLVFDRQGQLHSIALAPDIASRSPITRFYSRFGNDPGWDPGDDFVVLPHTTKEVQDIVPAGRSR